MSAPEFPEPRVGVLGARTFLLAGDHFQPVAMPQHWNDWDTETCVAACRGNNRGDPNCHCERCESLRAPHPSPFAACSCGTYSFPTAQEVARQYPGFADNCIAVVALAGLTLEGSIGWRSTSATIKAVWVRNEHQRTVLSKRYAAATFYTLLPDLLDAYPAADSGGIESFRRAMDEGRHANRWNRGVYMAPRNNGGTP